MVHGWETLRRRSLGLGLLGVLALDGCVTYPATVATRGQDAMTAERDASECQKRAEDEVTPPLVAGLGTKLLSALGGAGVGAGIVLGSLARDPGPASDPKWAALAVGGGAAVGFVIGTLVGTVKGADEASRAARDRQTVFTRCMTERGYRLE